MDLERKLLREVVLVNAESPDKIATPEEKGGFTVSTGKFSTTKDQSSCHVGSNNEKSKHILAKPIYVTSQKRSTSVKKV